MTSFIYITDGDQFVLFKLRYWNKVNEKMQLNSSNFCEVILGYNASRYGDNI